MTREDKLYSMKGSDLIKEADKLGIKVKCNKTRTQLTESKDKVVERILAFEAANEEPMVEEQPIVEEQPELVPMPGTEKLEELKKEYEQPKPKRGALIEFNGKAQNICAWGEELGISPNTLYGRIYKMNWPVDKAFTTPARKSK